MSVGEKNEIEKKFERKRQDEGNCFCVPKEQKEKQKGYVRCYSSIRQGRGNKFSEGEWIWCSEHLFKPLGYFTWL
jgi:hypothetical protein